MGTDNSALAADTNAAIKKKSYETEENVNEIDFKGWLEEGIFFLINLSKASTAIITYLFL